MSTTLNLAERLLVVGRNYQELGRDHDALHVFTKLVNFRDLPPDTGEEARSRLTDLLLRNGLTIKARRHLTALLVQRPESARYHYLMASALNGDEKSDPQRAAEHFRKSLELDPNQPTCLGEFGLLALRLGQSDEGLGSLRKAVELAPSDPEVVGRLAEGLRQEGMIDEARRTLLAARFRRPHDARFLKLWNDFQFHLLRQKQLEGRTSDDAVTAATDRRILPFIRPVSVEELEAADRPVRRDRPEPTNPPHAPRHVRFPSRNLRDDHRGMV